HRDVKPDNILFDAAGHVYLGDFGIAKALAASESSAGLDATFKTSAGLVVGTPQYMAPELITAQGCDGRVDQYALAVTVYEAVCGQVPFDGPTPASLVVQHATKPPPPPHEVASGIPLAFSTALLRGLAKEPAQRFRDCRSLAQALTTAVPSTKRRDEGFTAPPTDDGKERFTCPYCSTAFRLPAEKRGRGARCPRCQKKFIIGDRPVAAETPAGGLAPTPPAAPAVAPVPAAPQTATTPRRATPPPRPAGQPPGEETKRLARPLTVLPGDPLDAPPRDKGRWILGGVAVLSLVLLAVGLGIWLLRGRLGNSGSPGPEAKAVRDGDPSLERSRNQRQGGDDTKTLDEWDRAVKAAQNNDDLKAEALVGRADTYLTKNDCESAISDCTQALNLNHAAPHAATLRGIAYFRLKKYDQALADLTRGIDLDRNDARALLERGKLYLARRDFALAADDLRRARLVQPDNAEICYTLGETLRLKGRSGEAIENFSEALRLKPNYLDALGGRGSANRIQGSFHSALADLNAALEQRGDYRFALAERGEVHLRLSKYTDAIRDCTRALELGSKYYLAYRARGTAYRHLNKTEEALRDLKAAIEYGRSALDPWVAWGEVAEVYLMQGKYDDAVKNCDEAIRLNDRYGFSYATRGSAYRRKRLIDRALSDLNRALELTPADTFALVERGEIYLLKGKFADCIRDCTRAIQLGSKYYLAYRARGIAYCEQGETEKAIRDLTTALQGNDTSPDPWVAWWARGAAYCLQGNYDDAIKDYTQAVRQNSNSFAAYAKRGEAYRLRAHASLQRGNRSRATADFEQATKDLTKSIQLNPKYALAYRERAKIWRAVSKDASLQAQQASMRTEFLQLQKVAQNASAQALQDEATAEMLESK
ncbi:MAG TPA: tetratricopeptide repeat protein, partial [Gemmataceae bacterium]|nr:tetratricopeptide repeat protein [Gemmataceae bacterium]